MTRLRERGVALVIVLWGLTLVATAVLAIGFTARSETLATRNALEQARARQAAEGGVQFGLRRLLAAGRQRSTLAAGAPESFRLGDVAIDVAVADEEGKIDLNQAPFEFLSTAAGDNFDVACRILARRGARDSRCNDDINEPIAPFSAIEELRQMDGVDDALYARMAPIVTVYSGSAVVDPRVASADVLRAVPTLSDSAVDDYIERRNAGLTDDSDAPSDRRWFAVSSAATYQVSATATTPHGAQQRAEIVVRLTGQPARPYIVLAWRAPAG
jgi:general secretion pathway protein K